MVRALGGLSRPRSQSAVNQWNSNGPYGTIFTLQPGTNCSPPSGIVVQSSTATSVGVITITGAVNRPREMLKDGAQQGRVYHTGWAGELKATKAQIDVNPSWLTDSTVYAHELGHATGSPSTTATCRVRPAVHSGRRS